ncbi:SpoIIE family protein phosphatase [Kitasatospora sp. NPDC048365]|uniref:SpoIIE family protein phosphatase n=1 Tax=Kitasatospora sp. NPDC048365 TaxID=3364050 RepID=UPI00371D05B8
MANTERSAEERELAIRLRRAQREADRLRGRLATRALTALAVGALAERLHCSPADADRQLAHLAQRAGMSVPALAADLVAALAAEPPVDPAPPPGGWSAAQAPDGGGGDAARPGAAGPTEPEMERDAALAVRVVHDQAGVMLGTTAVVLWVVEESGAVRPMAASGLRAAELAGWERVPPGVDTPAQRVVGAAGGRYGPVGPAAATPGRDGAPYRLALPVRRDGRTVGVLELAWPEQPADPTAAELRRLRALTEVCALVLSGEPEPPPAGTPYGDLVEAVLDPAVLLEPLHDAEGEVADFRVLRFNGRFSDPGGRPPDELEGRTLLDVYPLAGTEAVLDLLRRSWSTGRATVRADLRVTFLTGGAFPTPTTVELAAAPVGGQLLLSWRLPEEQDRQAALLANAQRLARTGGFEEDLDSGETHWNERLYEIHGMPAGSSPMPLAALPAHVHPDDVSAVRRVLSAVLAQRRSASAVFRLVRPDGPARYTRLVAEPVTDDTGRVRAVRGAYQDVSAQHRTELALAATRERLADSEQESADRHRLALRLQQAIMPRVLPPLDRAGLRAAARYRPAAREERVGGDWYDAVLLPDDQVLLVVGDMAGHGVEAATGMVALRNALRGLAVTGAPPGPLLGWLNRAALELGDAATATAVCARYDPRRRELHWARAGHLPPVLIREGAAEPLAMPHGVLLGADPHAAYEERVERMEPGDILLLYTDGLVEQRERAVEEPLRELAAHLAAPADDLDVLLDRALARSPADTADDTCLIAIQVLDPVSEP